ncbi:MAG: very short patch repair endonuclease [Desulfomonilaceae bacterium]
MVDRVDRQTRHRIMSSNRGKNTGPELEIRKALFQEGFRFRLHNRALPGKPDIVLPRWHLVIFVHGCYWHGHECRRRPRAKSNLSFWADKIQYNKSRDIISRNQLIDKGWRILVVWECAVRRRSPAFSESDDLVKMVNWIKGSGTLAFLSETGFEECL